MPSLARFSPLPGPGLGLVGLLGVVGLTGLLSVAASARADEERIVDLELRVIYATKEKGAVDPDCVDIQKRLPMNFGSLRTVQSERFSLETGDAARFELPTGRPVTMLPVSVIGPHLHIHFQMAGVMNTRLQMESGRPVIVGGERHGDGQLILELTPSFTTLDGPSAPSVAQPEGPVVRPVRASPPGTR